MKKHILYWMFLLFIASPSLMQAQHYTSPVKQIYDQLSSKDDIQGVFITSGMLKMTMAIAGNKLEPEKRDSLRNLLHKMNEIILLGNLTETHFSKAQVNELSKQLLKSEYQKMVQMKEGNEELNVFVLEDPKKHTIKDLVVIMTENGGRTLLSITGDMTPEQLAIVASFANIDVSNFLRPF